MKRQVLILFYPTTPHSPPGALFETRGVTNETKESGDRSQEPGVRRQKGRAWGIESGEKGVKA